HERQRANYRQENQPRYAQREAGRVEGGEQKLVHNVLQKWKSPLKAGCCGLLDVSRRQPTIDRSSKAATTAASITALISSAPVSSTRLALTSALIRPTRSRTSAYSSVICAAASSMVTTMADSRSY